MSTIYYTITEAATLTNYHPNYLRRQAQAGNMPFFKDEVHRKWLIHRDHIPRLWAMHPDNRGRSPEQFVFPEARTHRCAAGCGILVKERDQICQFCLEEGETSYE